MSEFRQDPVSGDWILMSPERAARPSEFGKGKEKRKPASRDTCPFEEKRLSLASNWPPILSLPKSRKWRVIVIPNRFPALNHIEQCSEVFKDGPYAARTGIGHHDLIITRDHNKNISMLTPAHAREVLEILQMRYQQLVDDPCIVYTSAFFNWGPKAGASVYHPHYQILSLPIVPPDIHHSLSGSERYYEKNKACIHCEMLTYEKKIGKRIILENEEAIVMAPYVSRRSYEIRLFPKKHLSYFERSSPQVLAGVTDLLQKSLAIIRKKLHDPDLNFFIHTSPLKNQDKYHYYHWHMEIFPQLSTSAGFELSTGVDINTADPDAVAAFLKSSR